MGGIEGRCAAQIALALGLLVASAAGASAQCTLDATDPTWRTHLDDGSTCTLGEAFKAAQIGATVAGCLMPTSCSSVTINLRVGGRYEIGAPYEVGSYALPAPISGRPVLLDGHGSVIVGPDRDLGLIAVSGGVGLRMKDVVVREFDASLVHSVVYVERGSLRLEGVTFSDNHGDEGGAIGGTFASLDIRTSNFVRNRALSRGGAIFLDEGVGTTVTISLSRFEANETLGAGGAIALAGAGAGLGLDIVGSSFLENVAAGDGGALWGASPGLNGAITNSTFYGNESSGRGGAIYLGTQRRMKFNYITVVKNDAVMGGGGVAFVTPAAEVLTIANSLIAHNRNDGDFGTGCECAATPSGSIRSLGGNWSHWPEAGTSPCDLTPHMSDVTAVDPPDFDLLQLREAESWPPTVPLTSEMAGVCEHAGGEAGCSEAPLVDQRGVPREGVGSTDARCFPGAHTVQRVDVRVVGPVREILCEAPYSSRFAFTLVTDVAASFGVTLRVTGPPGLTIDSAVGEGFECTPSGHTVTCEALQIGTEATGFVITGHSTLEGTLGPQEWTVSAATEECDSFAANDTLVESFAGCSRPDGGVGFDAATPEAGTEAGMNGDDDAGMRDAEVDAGPGVRLDGAPFLDGGPLLDGGGGDAQRSSARSKVGGGGACTVALHDTTAGGAPMLVILAVAIARMARRRAHRGHVPAD